ncbi:hypothetical protein DY000_02020248 [Brassica cretica]|uniref:Uncharacterized protein n=1 Tax=Brassica cretica TaxID=69181 RepID=A0ABQ7DZY7_BRACR|nr:hypothetical protein DY000_02020248 [Brassica cretica]
MDEVRAKFDVVHELFRKQVCLAEGEVADTKGEENVNYIGGTGFQKFGNQGGNINFFGNSQKSNQSSQFQKPFNNSKSYSNSYQNPPPQTQENKIEEMLDRLLLGQQQITMDFNGKIDSAYNNLNNKIETLGTQVRKLETQVIQTGETIKRQEAFAREAGADKGKHHVNAIIDDDFWQVVRHEKLEEGDFKIGSSTSLGGSQWCRPMSMNSHRSTDHDEDRWMDYSSHRSTSSAKSTECNSESDVDRHNTPPIDRQAPLTYRVRLPSIDNDYINTLRPPPKPLASPPEPKPNPLNSSPEPVQEDQETEGRRLRKRKEKIPKNVKREANDKEMDGFTKRILRIPIEKDFNEAYFTHRLWMFFRETKVTEEDIRRMFDQIREKMRHRITLSKKSDPGKFAIPCVVKGVEFSHSMCDTGASVKYESEYSESIDTHTFPSIDSNESTITDDRNNTSLDVDQPVDHFAPPNHCYPHFAFQPPSKRGRDDYSIGSWTDSGFHESFVVDTVITSPNEEHTEEYDEDYWKERAIEMSLQDERLKHISSQPRFQHRSTKCTVHFTSVDTHPRPAKQPHRSTSSAKSTECNAVRILTHEEFAAKHPHPPSPFYDKIDRSVEPTIDRQSESDVDRHNTPPIDPQAPLTYRVRLPSIDNDYINALKPTPKALANPPEPKPNPLNSSPEPVEEEQETEGRRLRKKKEKIPKNLKREANDKEMDGFTKKVLRIPIEKAFDEAYFTHRLWMFFRETNVTEEDIRRMFHQVREKMKHRITLTKKSDPGKFAIPCVVKGVEFPHSMYDTGASVSILPRIMADQLEYESEYETEYSESIDTPTFPSIDSNDSTVTDDRNNTSLDVKQPVDHFTPPNHCYPHFAFQPPSKRGHDDYFIGSWADSGFHESFTVDTVITSSNEEHTEEYDEDYWKERAIEMSLQDERFETHKFTNTIPTSFDAVHSTSVDTHPRSAKHPLTSIDTHTGTSIDIRAIEKIQEQENIHSPNRFTDTYINRFAPPKQPQHTRADTQENKMNTLPSTSTGKSMKNNHLKNTSSVEITLPSIDASVSRSIDTTLNPNLSISKLNDNANIDYGFLTPDEFGIFRDLAGNARAIDGRILQVSREDIADILQVANGPDNLFSQQRGTPDVIQTDPNNHVGVTTTEINTDLSREPKGQASIDGTTETSIDRVTPTSIDRDDLTSIDRRYEFGNRAFDMYGARKFTWE